MAIPYFSLQESFDEGYYVVRHNNNGDLDFTVNVTVDHSTYLLLLLAIKAGARERGAQIKHRLESN